ncbi:AAA family ATPase [Runella salmonicolor]|uniref:AAA family ATPase n=1 Tax=Runella salmonicolor TaxID=2950278 RepID=A0ABT1FGL9_9BACT|nr:AAA family ATPase [Runella salmonicolor]MCP1380895.1 AAA family ATPase [Runella salmonicolor]
MKLQKLHIKNFKSIVDLEIVEPNPFTVFVGPNGSGKSNIFEALEFWSFHLLSPYVKEMVPLFRGAESIINRLKGDLETELRIDLINFPNTINKVGFDIQNGHHKFRTLHLEGIPIEETSLREFYKNYSRIFIKNKEVEKIELRDNTKLSLSASNLEKVLKRILQDEIKREEIKEWLDLFIPGFENIEIVSSELSGTDTLVMYEKGIKKPFTKDLLSDGTYNILALLTAVYQSDEPQFLCIEEPENGLHPKVIKELVHFFRDACQEKGHYIWLNTHSQTLVAQLQPEEIILVNKKQGETITKQLKNHNLHGLRMDEAWLTAALGGGLPW